MYVADSIIAFQAQHPGLTAELLLDDSMVDLDRDAIDAAIRLGRLNSSGLVARKLGIMRRIVVASPGYLAAHGTPTTVDDLASHRQVRFNGAPEGDDMPLVGPHGPLLVRVPAVFQANNAFVLTRALLAGLGLGGVQLPLVAKEIAEGTLIRVLPDYQYAPLDIHAVLGHSRSAPTKVRAFLSHLEQSMRSWW